MSEHFIGSLQEAYKSNLAYKNGGTGHCDVGRPINTFRVCWLYFWFWVKKYALNKNACWHYTKFVRAVNLRNAKIYIYLETGDGERCMWLCAVYFVNVLPIENLAFPWWNTAIDDARRRSHFGVGNDQIFFCVNLHVIGMASPNCISHKTHSEFKKNILHSFISVCADFKYILSLDLHIYALLLHLIGNISVRIEIKFNYHV